MLHSCFGSAGLFQCAKHAPEYSGCIFVRFGKKIDEYRSAPEETLDTGTLKCRLFLVENVAGFLRINIKILDPEQYWARNILFCITHRNLSVVRKGV